MTEGTQPPAGWYPDPEQAGQQRYWDGAAWAVSGAPLPERARASDAVVPADSSALPGRSGWFRRHWKGLTIGAVALFVGVAIGAGGKKNDTSKQDAQITAQAAQIQDLTARDSDLQKQVDDRAAKAAADKAHAAAAKADEQAAKDQAAAAAKAKTAAAANAKIAAAAKAKQAVDAAAAAAAQAAAQKNTIAGDGIYAVGPDVNPGQWRTSGGPTCYYAVLNSSDTNDIATNNLGDGQQIADLALGKYFETKDCGSWTHS